MSERKEQMAITKNSRRPRGRFGRGLTKKGGAGGKGTWGKLGSELVGFEERLEDPHDPNYDSDNQENLKLDVITPPLDDSEIEKHVKPVIIEYFEHGDTDEVATSLDEFNFGAGFYKIIVMVISLALERKASCREMASVLISDLYNRLLLEDDYERAFDVLLTSLPDIALDTPNAAEVLGNFIARAVADDCIPPKFVQAYVACHDLGREAVAHANTLLNLKHGLVKLDSVWGVSGGMRPVKYLIRQIHSMLREYFSSNDMEEVRRCLQELEVPHFYHEFVYEAVVMAIEDMGDQVTEQNCRLLKHLADSAVLTVDQIKNGFNRVYEDMPDINIDVPLAYTVLEKFVNKANSMGFLPRETLKNLPQRGRKRFVSEGDGGRIKE